MLKKMLATLTAVAAALLVVGVAWAGTTETTSTSVTAAGSSSSSADGVASTAVTAGSSTSVSVGPSTPTSLDDDDESDDDSTTVTTLGVTTSTSVRSTTSTSDDDDENDDEDEERVVVIADGRSTHQIPGVGSVTIEVTAGVLALVDVSAPGWEIELDKIEPDRIEVEFRSGEAEAQFEARIRDGRVDVEIEIDSD